MCSWCPELAGHSSATSPGCGAGRPPARRRKSQGCGRWRCPRIANCLPRALWLWRPPAPVWSGVSRLLSPGGDGAVPLLSRPGGQRRLLSMVLKGASRATARLLPLLQPRAAAGILSSICFSPTSLPSTPSTPQACSEGVMGMELVSTPAGEAPPPGLAVGQFHPDSLGSGSEWTLGSCRPHPALCPLRRKGGAIARIRVHVGHSREPSS